MDAPSSPRPLRQAGRTASWPSVQAEKPPEGLASMPPEQPGGRLGSLKVLGVGRPRDHKSGRPEPMPAQASMPLRAGGLRDAGRVPPAQLVDERLRAVLQAVQQGPHASSRLLCRPRETGQAYAARLNSALDAVVQVPGCSRDTPAGREKILGILLQHAAELVNRSTSPGIRPLPLGPGGADHRDLFDALLQRLLAPLSDLTTPGAPPHLAEAFALLESDAVMHHPLGHDVARQGMFALARAFGGERMAETTLGLIESLIFTGDPRRRDARWLRGILIGLALGVSPLVAAGREEPGPVQRRAETLGLDHLQDLGPRQIEALWHLPLPLLDAARYTPEQLGAMVVARRCKPLSLRPGPRPPTLGDLHKLAAKSGSPLSAAHLVAFGCAATRTLGIPSDGHASEQADRQTLLPRYPAPARALWELGARLAVDPTRVFVAGELSPEDQQTFFRVAVEVLDPAPAQCAQWLSDGDVADETVEALLQSRPAEYAWAALPEVRERLLAAVGEVGAPEAAPARESKKALALPDAASQARARLPSYTQLLTFYGLLAQRCLAARGTDRTVQQERVHKELLRVQQDPSLARMPALQAMVCEQLQVVLGQLKPYDETAPPKL